VSKDIIGALRVTLGFDTSQFEHGSERAKQTVKRDAAVIKNEVSGVRRAIGDLALAFVGAEAVQAAKRALDYAASIKSVATQAGVSRRELQEYRYAASQADLTQQEMDGTLQKLTKTIGEANAGTKSQATVFRDLGVAVQDANGRIYSAGEVLPKLADALSRIKDPATRARLEVQLFGEAGQKLDSLLMQGSRGIETMRQRARELGIVLADDLTDGAADANDKLAEIKMTLDARFAAAIAQNSNAVLGLANALATLTSKGLELVNEYPRISTALAGMVIGSRFGAPGALIGGVGGALGGDYIARSNADSNMDLKFRKQQLQAARDELNARQQFQASGSLFQIRRTGSNTQGGTIETATAELQRQTDLLWQAVARANGNQGSGNASVVPDGALPVPNPGRTRKGPKDRSQQIEDAYLRDLHGLVNDTLSARASMATSAQERAELEHRMLNDDIRFKKAEIENNADYSKVRKDKLLFELQEYETAERQRIDWQKDDAIREEQARIDQAALDHDRDMLSIRASLATTAKDRRAIQLELLDNDLKSVRLAAEEVLARHDSTDAERRIAQAKLDQLAELKSGETLRINRETMGPLDTYLDSIPDTVDEINEAYENLAVSGLRNFNDGLADSAAHFLKLKGFAGQLFNQLIADLIRFQMQQAMGGGGLLGGLIKLGGSVLGLSGNPLAGSIDTAYSNVSGMAAGIEARNLSSLNFAGGGDMTILGRRGIDRNVLSLNGLPIANVSYGERLSIANDNAGQRMAAAVYITPSPYFDARVDQRAYGVAAPIGMQAANAGSSGAQVAISRAGARQIP
jgi:hypothetical protein